MLWEGCAAVRIWLSQGTLPTADVINVPVFVSSSSSENNNTRMNRIKKSHCILLSPIIPCKDLEFTLFLGWKQKKYGSSRLSCTQVGLMTVSRNLCNTQITSIFLKNFGYFDTSVVPCNIQTRAIILTLLKTIIY